MSDVQDQLDRDYRRMCRLFDALPDPTLFVNEQGMITRINLAGEIFFGYDREQMLGEPVTMLMPERYRQAHDNHIIHYFGNKQVRPMGVDLNIVALKSNGTEEPVTIMLAPFPEEVLAVVRSKRGQ